MSIFKIGKARKSAAEVSGRRNFLWKVGAGVSTAMASTATMATAPAGAAEGLALQVALLEDEKTLRQLHQAYERAIDEGQVEELLGLFAEDAEVQFNGGVFRKRAEGLNRLYRQRFAASHTGKRMAPAPGFELAPEQLKDRVEISPDRLSARAVFPYSIQVGNALNGNSSLVNMARLQGEGVQTWWEGGVYDIRYVRDAADGSWKIRQLAYRTLSRADYRPGRSYAKPITVPAFTARYPADPQGPDRLV